MARGVSKEEKILSLAVALLLVAQAAMFGLEHQTKTSEAREEFIAREEVVASEQLEAQFCWQYNLRQVCLGGESLAESDHRLLDVSH